jgi:prevent-host-death family protein
MMLVTRMSVSEAREKLSEVIDTAQSEAVVLERYGRPAAVLVSLERYQQLVDALEEAEDVAAFDAAMAEEGDNIPWEQVRADLGWS